MNVSQNPYTERKKDTKAYLPVVARDQGLREVWPAKGYEESLGSNGDVLKFDCGCSFKVVYNC